MTTYNNTFGNDTVPPSQYGYQALSISANTTLVWPYNSTGGTTTSKLIDLTATAGSLSLTLPDATQVSTGEDVLIRNVGAQSVTIKDNGGGTIGTVSAGAASYFYLTSNSTAAGTWGLIAYGVGTSAVDAATLVGYGLIASGSTLNQASPVTTDAGSTVTVDATYRAKTLVLTGGAATVALPAVATAADNFFLFLRNGGTGTATINPDGAELIDGASTLGIQPGESLMLVCSGAAWYTVGYGRAVLYQFSQLVKDVSAAGSFTLSASEASNKLLTFTGNPAGAVTIVVPNTVAVYYTQSSISTAQTITIKTAAGTGASVTQSQRVIVICDGTNVVAAQSAAATSAVSYPAGSAAAPSINFSASTNTGIFLKGVNGVGISANGSEVMAVETTGTTLAAPLVVASGGTGRATSTTAYGLIAAGTSATGAQQTLAAGATTEILVGGGAAALPVWTVATGSGAPVRANTPTLTTPVLGVATATSINKLTLTQPATGATVTITDGKTFAATNTLTFTGTDGTTLDVKGGANLNTLAALTLAQGDLLYSTGVGVVANLAKGSALQVLRMNAGATAPEWAAASSGAVTRTEFTASGSMTIPSGVTQVLITGQAPGGGGGGLTGAGSNGGNLTFGKNGDAVSITLTGGAGGGTISGATAGTGGAGGGSGLQQGRSGQNGQYSQSVGGGVNPAAYAVRRGGRGGTGLFGELGSGGDGADSSVSGGGVTSDGGGGGGGAGEQVFRKLVTVTSGQWDVTIGSVGGAGTGTGGGTVASAGKGGFLVVEYVS